MPGSLTTPGQPARLRLAHAGRVAFRYTDSVGTRKSFLSRLESSGGHPDDSVRPTALAEPDVESYSIRLPV